MAHSVASIEALLTAESYSAARRALRELLRENPDDSTLHRLQVKIEVEAGEHRQALEYVRAALQMSPDDIELRYQEIDIVMALNQRSEVRTLAERFKQDFPYDYWRLEGVKLSEKHCARGFARRPKSIGSSLRFL